MSIDFEDTDKNIVKKPQVFLKSVTFNDNVQLINTFPICRTIE